MVPAIASTSSSFEYSWSESKLKLGDLNSSRLRVLKCLLDDQNSRLAFVPDDRYAVSNRSGYAIRCIGQRTGYAISDGSGYAVYNYQPEQHGYAISSLMDMAYWSSE
ncbi:hypothetical protein Tco_0002344 [Tanacetum coccineum]